MADLKNFFELTSDLMGVASLEGRFQTVNAAFERMLGYHPNEIVGRSFIDLVHPDDYQESQFELVQIGYRAAAANTNTLHSDTARPDTVRFSNRCACKNGEWRQLEWTLSIVDGSLYCIGHDMTQRMDSLARYKLLADHATDIISRQTLTGDYLYVSPACYEVIGYSPEEMIGRNRYDFIHPGDVASIRSTMDRIDQQSETFSLVFRARHKAGHYVWMEAIQRKLQASDSSNTQTQTDPQAVKEVVVVARDVTKRILDQQKIQQFNQELEGRVTRRTQELEDSQSRYLELLKLEREGYARAELARATAQLYAEAVENMQVGLHIWQLKDFDDPTSLTLIATNPAAAKLIGIPVESVVNQRIAEAFPAVKNTDIPETYAGVVKSKIMVDLGEIIYGDSRVQRSIFAVKAFPLSEDCLGVAFDNITERKEAEAIRQDQAARLRILFDQSAVGLSRVSMAGEWMQVNQRLCDMLGYSMAELLGNNYRAVTHPDDLEVNQAAYKQLVDDHQPQVSYEKRYFTKSGEILWAHVTASLHKTKRGNIFGDSEDSVETESSYFIATIQDITQRKQAILALKKQKNDLVAVNMMLTNTMAQLEQRNSELDQFAYVTSHDLKAPLRAIANLAGWIEEDLGDRLPAENKEQLDLLKSRVLRMEGFINGLLEYSRIGRTHQSSEIVDVAVLLADIVDSISPLGQFSVDIVLPMPVLKTKRVPLLQVFSNLITNAIKHHDREDGQVRVCAVERDGYYEFLVADDGPGIDAVYHDRIFAIFQTLRSRDDIESTGIGLSLVKKTVEAEGGKITVHSEEGKGATFTFTWPKEPSAAE